MLRLPGFVGPSYTSQSRLGDCERLVNWYPERIESSSGKAEFVLYPTPGFEVFCTLPTSPVRGLYALNGRTFAVGGTVLYEIATDGTVTTRGTGLPNLDDTAVQICSNGDGGHQLLIASNSKAYLYDLTANTLTFILDDAAQVAFLDGFFLALNPQTSTYRISDAEDGATWDALQIHQRSDAPDRWSAMLVSHKEIWLFGSATSSVHYDSGADPFPFEANPSVFINHGITAPNSAAILDNAPVWLGQSADGGGIVYRANGYTPVRISTHAMEYALSTYDTLSDAEGWTYEEHGHPFYVLNFPTAEATWVYDVATGSWHERGAWNGSRFVSLPVRGHCFAGGVHLTGDASTGVVYRMGTDVTEDGGGRTLRRLRRAPHLGNLGGRVTFNALQIELEAGLGIASGQGSDPQVMLRWSDDGAQTWSAERWASAGAEGAYRSRAIWRRLGQARDRVFEVSVTDPIPWRLIDAYVALRPGAGS